MSRAEFEKQMEFDVFVSHNSEDKQAVAKLAVKLKERGLNPWFDQWYFNGGEQWLSAIERALHNSRSCVVVVGVNGFGKVHEEEMWRALEIAMDRKHAGRDYPVIPVLLRFGTRGNPTKLPSFLAARTCESGATLCLKAE
jgi:hypothetical protein